MTLLIGSVALAIAVFSLIVALRRRRPPFRGWYAVTLDSGYSFVGYVSERAIAGKWFLSVLFFFQPRHCNAGTPFTADDIGEPVEAEQLWRMRNVAHLRQLSDAERDAVCDKLDLCERETALSPTARIMARTIWAAAAVADEASRGK